MMKMLRKKRKGGFTLIELIVVIAILGILAAIAVPRLMNFTDDATTSSRQATARTIESAYTIYSADTTPGAWPGDYISGATASGNSITIPGDATTYTLVPATGQVTHP